MGGVYYGNQMRILWLDDTGVSRKMSVLWSYEQRCKADNRWHTKDYRTTAEMVWGQTPSAITYTRLNDWFLIFLSYVFITVFFLNNLTQTEMLIKSNFRHHNFCTFSFFLYFLSQIVSIEIHIYGIFNKQLYYFHIQRL